MGYARGYYNNNILVYKDTVLSPAVGTSPFEQVFTQAFDDPGSGFLVSDHFYQLQNQATNGLWLVTKGTGGSIVLSADSGLTSMGWIKIPTAASASDYVEFSTQKPVCTLQSNIPLAFEVSLNLTEAATNASSWFAGFTSTVATGFLTSSGVPPTSYSGAVVYKTTGAMAINAQTSNSTTQVTTATALATAVSGTTLQIGGVLNPNNNTTALFTPYISTVASNLRKLVTVGATMNLTIASLSNMYFAFGLYCGSGGTAETLYVDYAQVAQGMYYQ